LDVSFFAILRDCDNRSTKTVTFWTLFAPFFAYSSIHKEQLKMNGEKLSIYLRRALLSSIAVLTVGFLGFGVRAFSTPDLTRLVFAGVVVVSIGILVWYFILHRSTRESKTYSAFRGPSLAKRSILSRLSGWTTSGVRWLRSTGPVLRRVWHRIGDSFLPRKAPMKPGERMGAEAGVVRVEKRPDSRRAA
jgi:hypothetical protein